jgi:hypothetical protein
MTSNAIENAQASNEDVVTPVADLLATIKRNPVTTAFVVAAAAVGCPFGMTGMLLGGIVGGATVGLRATVSPGLMNRIQNAGWGAFGGAMLSVFPIAGVIFSFPLGNGTEDVWKNSVRAEVHDRIGNGEDLVVISKQAKLCNLSLVAWKQDCENVAFQLTEKVVSRAGAVAVAEVNENGGASPSYKVTLLPATYKLESLPPYRGSERVVQYQPARAAF